MSSNNPAKPPVTAQQERRFGLICGGDVNGIRSIAGGLGIAAVDNNASVVTQLQVMF